MVEPDKRASVAPRDALAEAQAAAERILAAPEPTKAEVAARLGRAQLEVLVQARVELYASKNFPRFAPSDGICWACRRQIFEVEDGSCLVTCCPHCHRSYVD